MIASITEFASIIYIKRKLFETFLVVTKVAQYL